MKQLRPCLRVYCLVAGVFALLLPIALVSWSSSALAATSVPDQGTSSPEKPPSPPVVEYVAGLLSVTAKDVDVRAVVEAIGAKSGIEIVLDKVIAGKVTVEFKAMKFEDGLKVVLNGVVEGGFSSEYVRGTSDKGQLELRKVTIVRLGEKDLQAKDATLVTDIAVQDAVGKEVVFAKWGAGKGEIEPRSIEIDGRVYRNGFARLRVDDQGNIYFIGFAHQKVFIFDQEGHPKSVADFELQGTGFDVDHEGNIYIYELHRGASTRPQTVLVYGPDGKLREKVVIPLKDAVFSAYAVIEDGMMRDASNPEFSYDFRRFLKQPDAHSTRRKVLSNPMFIYEPHGSYRDDIAEGLVFVGRGRPGSKQTEIRLRVPSGWDVGDDSIRPIGVRNDRLYLLTSLASGSPYRFYSDYAIAVVDLSTGRASYHRVAEKDSYVYEEGNLRSNYERYDVDIDGNVFQLFTTHDGVHVYKYELGGARE